MAANWMTATTINNILKIFHPRSLFALPPVMMVTNPTRVASSATVAKLMRNPTVRHIAQKSPDSAHSLSDGKRRHGGSATELQLWCSPIVREKVAPEDDEAAV